MTEEYGFAEIENALASALADDNVSDQEFSDITYNISSAMAEAMNGVDRQLSNGSCAILMAFAFVFLTQASMEKTSSSTEEDEYATAVATIMAALMYCGRTKVRIPGDFPTVGPMQ